MSCICQNPEATQVTVNGIVYCETIDTLPPSCTPKSCPPNYQLINGECVRNFNTGKLCPDGYDYIYDEQNPSNSKCVFYEDSLASCTCTADVIAQPQTICSGQSTSIALTSTLPGMVFSWTASSPDGVTGAANGSGNIINQTLTANAAQGTVNYVITPYEPGANGCAGEPVTITVTVNPVPSIIVVPSSPQSIAGGDTINIALSSPLAGTTFAWTVVQSTGITGATSGSGNTITNTINATSNGTATYSITATAPNGCTTTVPFVVNVASPIVNCLVSGTIVIRYQEAASPPGTPVLEANPCPNQQHDCDIATFNLLLNGVNVGVASLNNHGGTPDLLNYPPPGTPSTSDRYNVFSITPTQAALIATASVGGWVNYQLTCALSVCHSGVAWVTVYSGAIGSTILYNGCPTNNFLSMNPCTGAIQQ